MLQTVFAVVTLFADMIMESSVLPFLKIGGVMPNTAIIIIVSFAILRGSFEGLIFGFFTGLAFDVFFGNAIGFSAIIYMYIAYFSGKLTKDFFPENLFMPVLFSTIGCFIYELLYYVFYFLLLGKINIGFYMTTIILPEIVYTSVLSIVIYHIMYLINKPIYKYQLNKRKLFDQ